MRSHRDWKSERGVAMVTVLFVGAVLTVVAATASFSAIQELSTSNDDRVASQALAHAEAGVDRAVVGIRRGGAGDLPIDIGSWPWKLIMQSGCPNKPLLRVTGNVGNGTFTAEVRPQTQYCDDATVPLPNQPQRVNITSTGVAGGSTRTVMQEVRLLNTSLPIGLFASADVNVNGAGNNNPARIRNVSLVTGGNLQGRNFIAFESFDPWYTQQDFYGPSFPDVRCPQTGGAPNCSIAQGHLPSAAHSEKVITCQGNGPCGSTTVEHDLTDDHPLSCNSNPNGSVANQSAWDGSVNGAPTAGALCGNTSVGAPPTTKYPADGVDPIVIPTLSEEEHQNLKAQALDSGLYCTLTRCRIRGGAEFNNAGSWSGNEAGWNTLPQNFTAYFDYTPTAFPPPQSHTVNWSTTIGPCNNTSTLNRSAIVVVRNGSFSMSGGNSLAGAVIAQEGRATFAGGSAINGSVLAREITMSGNSNFTIDDCALKNLLNPFIDVTPIRWTELDRT